MNDVKLANPIDDCNVTRFRLEVLEAEGERTFTLGFLVNSGNWKILVLLFVQLTQQLSVFMGT